MVKGVSRNVIEIVDTGSELFERAILFLRPQGRERGTEEIDASARSFLRGLRLRRRWFPQGRYMAALLKYVSAMGIGAMLTALFLKL